MIFFKAFRLQPFKGTFQKLKGIIAREKGIVDVSEFIEREDFLQ